MKTRPTLAITCGEPAGIGPEIALNAAWRMRASVNCVLIGDVTFLSTAAAAIDPAIALQAVSLSTVRQHGFPAGADQAIMVLHCPLSVPVIPGKPDPDNGRYVVQTLDIAIEGTQSRWFDAIVTAPLQKSTLNQAGIAFTGHTEYLAQKTQSAHVVMMLTHSETAPSLNPVSNLGLNTLGAIESKSLRVALATTHLALKDVPAAITFDGLSRTLDILHHDLQRKFGIPQPAIFVTGLNPHAGEGGYLGREEIDVIMPALTAAQARGIDARGPYPADTLFQEKYLRHADCVLAMYHDQGLPVLKYASFGQGVNITLGLPIIRTSVDHGTALDLAAQGFGHADCGSMIAAMKAALHMVAASSSMPS